MLVTPTQQMKKLEQTLRAWCADPTSDPREQVTKNIRKWLASSRPQAAAMAAARLDDLAEWYGQQGALAVLDGRAAGWADIDRALHYFWWRIRIDPAGTLVSKMALVLAHAMTFEEKLMADWLATWLIEALHHSTLVTHDCTSFAAFVLNLWTIHQGSADVVVARPSVAVVSAYQRVLDTWSNTDSLRSALRTVCNHHIAQALTPRGEFAEVPYPMFPVDVLAIARVRRDLGLEMPTVEHALLSTALAALPPHELRPRMGPDPLLEQVIQKAKDTGLL